MATVNFALLHDMAVKLQEIDYFLAENVYFLSCLLLWSVVL